MQQNGTRLGLLRSEGEPAAACRRTCAEPRIGANWLVTLRHPENAKSVSLKASTGDETGEVAQTIIRAYDLKQP